MLPKAPDMRDLRVVLCNAAVENLACLHGALEETPQFFFIVVAIGAGGLEQDVEGVFALGGLYFGVRVVFRFTCAYIVLYGAECFGSRFIAFDGVGVSELFLHQVFASHIEEFQGREHLPNAVRG